MSSATVLAPVTLVQNTTPEFRLVATKNGSIWTGAMVTLLLRKPDGSLLGPLIATETPVNSGIYIYDALTTDLSQIGDWVRTWRLEQAGIDVRSIPVTFSVIMSP